MVGTMKDIVDEIDQLVSDSLSRPIVDDYRVDRYDRCFHCSRPWHGIPLTRRIADMYQHGHFDESYRVDEDDSEILCQGSNFIGPMRAPTRSPYQYNDQFDIDGTTYHFWSDNPFYPATQQRWWRTTLPSDAEVIQYNPETHTYTIEIGDNSETFTAENVRMHREQDEDLMIHQSNTRMFPNERMTMDVLQENAPNIGGTWQPLTALSVVVHPDESWIAYPENDDSGLRMLEALHATGWMDIGTITEDSIQ
jgi:hypothetical protein